MIPLNNVKNIIFDFGGVILNLDYKTSEQEFRKLGIKDYAKLIMQIEEVHLFDELEKGNITPEKFCDDIRSLIGESLTDKQINDAWNSMLLDIPKRRIETLVRLKKQYRLFLLSNSNAIHYKIFRANLEKEYGYASFDELFDKVYFSFRLGMIKPDCEIYELVLRDSGLNASETLFVEDTAKNLVPAKELGLQTCLLKPGEDMADLFV